MLKLSVSGEQLYLGHTQMKFWIVKNCKGYYCPRPFTWRLDSIAVILFGSLRLGLCNGTAQQVLADQTTFCAAVFAPLLHVHTAHTVRTTEKCYYGR
jgi:hypothetical protein